MLFRSVIMVVGVNGVGKTTTIGKLAHQFKQSGKSVILGAADTFRAAAREQLVVWGERNQVHVVAQEGGDPAAIAFDAVSADDFRRVYEINLIAAANMTQAVTQRMPTGGRIINITSVVSQLGNPGQANYAAAKAGLIGMSKSLAQELASRGITVNCVAPGFIETDMTASLPQEQQKALLAQIPLGHLGKPEDVAHAVAFLASARAAYVTGQEWHVNGGMFMA